MKQRALDLLGDFTFGLGRPFLSNSPACVAQAILTRLRLEVGEWFLDNQDGTDYKRIVGYNNFVGRDLAIRARILDTPGVTRIAKYNSTISVARRMVVNATVDTAYGRTQIVTTF